jgi:hypothetical protein
MLMTAIMITNNNKPRGREGYKPDRKICPVMWCENDNVNNNNNDKIRTCLTVLKGENLTTD